MSSGDLKPPGAGPPPGDYEGPQNRPSDSNPAASADIPSSKPGWFDPQHNMPAWNPQQPVSERNAVQSYKSYAVCSCVLILTQYQIPNIKYL